ncbi:hypothetical protein BH11PSE11_BH11PSE11_20110 [soil metagenome]
MRNIIAVLLLIAAGIHLAPLVGAFGASSLGDMYGLSFEEKNIQILMRHRAVLFGILGAFLGYAAFVPRLQALAFAAGLASVLSYIWLALAVGSYNAALNRILLIDLLALACLMIGAGMRLILLRSSPHLSDPMMRQT